MNKTAVLASLLLFGCIDSAEPVDSADEIVDSDEAEVTGREITSAGGCRKISGLGTAETLSWPHGQWVRAVGNSITVECPLRGNGLPQVKMALKALRYNTLGSTGPIQCGIRLRLDRELGEEIRNSSVLATTGGSPFTIEFPGGKLLVHRRAGDVSVGIPASILNSVTNPIRTRQFTLRCDLPKGAELFGYESAFADNLNETI
jgi:hypothetical protein